MFDFLTGKSKQNAVKQEIFSLEAQRNAAVRKSKSRVANILSKPGEVVYTNKNRIKKEFGDKIAELLSQIEQPEQTKSALESVSTSLETALKSQRARETGAIILTIPVGIAQLAIKAIRIFLAIFIFFIGAAPAMMGAEGAISEAVVKTAPNIKFNTTRSFYQGAREFTGASEPLYKNA